MKAEVDHLVVAARTLDEGVRWCQDTLGIEPGPGGHHPLMSTHNRLFALGGAAFANTFFEIIAIDPDAPSPGRARWFGLDAIDLSRGPRLVTFVARVPALDAALGVLRDVGTDPGRALEASRQTPTGLLRWRIAVRDDGAMLCGGALPTLIDWGRTPHPTASMPPSGVTLQALTLRGLPAAAMQALALPGVGFDAAAGPAISAVLDTPRGRVTLTSD